MKDPPFSRRVQSGSFFDAMDADIRHRFETLRVDAERRIKSVPVRRDVRRGLAEVHATDLPQTADNLLNEWGWRRGYGTVPGAKPSDWVCDDPLGADPTERLGRRTRSAMAFAEAARAYFGTTGFSVRPLVLVPYDAMGAFAPGAGGEDDTLVVDLMIGIPHHRILDRLVAEVFDRETSRGFSLWTADLRYPVWQMLDRLNSVRRIFRPDLPEVPMPGRTPIRRRLEALLEKTHPSRP